MIDKSYDQTSQDNSPSELSNSIDSEIHERKRKSRKSNSVSKRVENKTYLSPIAINQLMMNNRQYKCIKCKGKKKEEGICLIDNHAIYVLFQRNNCWEVNVEVELTSILKIMKSSNGMIKIVYGKEENQQSVVLIIEYQLEKFLEELESKGK